MSRRSIARAVRLRIRITSKPPEKLLAPFVGTNAVETDVRAMLGKALLDVGREIEGRRALEVVLRVEPDFLDGYTLLAEHAYELGPERRGAGHGARRRQHARNGPAHVHEFLRRSMSIPIWRASFRPVASGASSCRPAIGDRRFRWISGRLPESEGVIDDHRRLPDENALRAALLRSQEFMEFFDDLIRASRRRPRSRNNRFSAKM